MIDPVTARQRPGRWRGRLLLVLLTALAYANAVPRALVQDDALLAGNPAFEGGLARIPQLFQEPVRRNPAGGARLYRPLAMATLALDHSRGAGDPRAYHETSVALHVVTTAALLGLLGALGAPAVSAWLAALLFGVHPIHTEAVDVAFNRSEVLATLFVVLALWSLAAWARQRPVVAWLAASVLYFLGLLSRESAVTLPVLAVLLRTLFGEGGTWRARLRGAAGAAALLIPFAAYWALRQAALGEPGGGMARSLLADSLLAGEGPWLRVTLVIATLRDYWRMVVWPWPLRATYEGYVVNGVAAAALLHLALVWAAWALRRRAPALGFGIGFFYVALLPSTKLFADPAVLAERFVYLPSAGLAVALGFGFAALQRRWSAAPVWTLGLAAALVLASLTLVRNAEWHSRKSLAEAEARRSPNDWKALLNLSQLRLDEGQPQEALGLCERGLALVPTNPGLHSNRGIALAALGRVPEAEASLRRAIELSGGRTSDRANLARLIAASGRRAEAAAEYTEAIASETGDAERHALRGELLLYCNGDTVAAQAEFEAALALNPRLATARHGLGQLARVGR